MNYSKILIFPVDNADRDYSEVPFTYIYLKCRMFTYLGFAVTHEMDNLEKHYLKSLAGWTKPDFRNWLTFTNVVGRLQ